MNSGLCYAVVNSSTSSSGIYFSLEEVKKQVTFNRNERGGCQIQFQGFNKLKDAESFLRSFGLAPVFNGGWVSAKRKDPIIYTKKRQKQDNTNRDDKKKLQRVWNNYQHQQNTYHEEPINVVDDSNPEPTKQHQQKPNRKRTRTRIQVKQENNDDVDSGYRGKTTGLPSRMPPPTQLFDAVQQRAIDEALSGKNVFITGVAGTGKSLVTKKIVEDAKLCKKEVAVAAPTGVAAVNLGPELGAQTVHSLAGIGIPQTASDFNKIVTSPWTIKKWKKIDILVLDEIGMLSADFLDWLDVYVRKARANPLQAFGGIQLIFVGDFAQLGPIPGKNSLRKKAYNKDHPGADCILNISECAAYPFQTVFWREADFHHVHLRQVYRQKNKDFQLALLDIRSGNGTSQRVKNLVTTCSFALDDRPDLEIPSGIKPTILYCTNRNVDRENYDNLAKLQGQGKTFKAKDSTSLSGEVSQAGQDTVIRLLSRNTFFNDCPAGRSIVLKIGAQVMLLQNLDLKKGLVNGSRGVVESFKLVPVVKSIINGEEELIGPNDMDKFPGFGSLEELKFGQRTDFGGKIWKITKFERYPFVRFVNNVSQIIVPEKFERTLYRQGSCIRKQIPLKLAWAITIHKSQGATIDFVVCDLAGCFTSGQAYVALSRARSLVGLQIKNFNSNHVTADPLVTAFYDALDRQDMRNFLAEKAGLWWYPILQVEPWLKMFSRATPKNARDNASTFRSWINEYKPLDDYRGWGSR